MIITLIIIATAGMPGEEPEHFQRQIVMHDLTECQSAIKAQVTEVMHSRPDVRSVSATCYVTTGGVDL